MDKEGFGSKPGNSDLKQLGDGGGVRNRFILDCSRVEIHFNLIVQGVGILPFLNIVGYGTKMDLMYFLKIIILK